LNEVRTEKTVQNIREMLEDEQDLNPLASKACTNGGHSSRGGKVAEKTVAIQGRIMVSF
jgi:hypothetical protein